ncbi:hypothetical protein MIND_00193000 [Mycena indigotica]|uniref:Uncharacterized protein n=1 Tax=Mycena indigotica TaxID=2126181 RepID=A0A8H6T4A9_9AGAR|nr:uncharacterized protein MIND_00193000 [Mycena indigotica]KAF7311825.1 hypothetical protein MIND_00193000 [Mycena indigotica]
MFPSNSPAPTTPTNAPVSPTPSQTGAAPAAQEQPHSHSHGQPHTHVSHAMLITVLTRALDDKQREVDGLNREVEHLEQHLAKAGARPDLILHVHSPPRQAVPAPAMMPMPTPTPMPFRVEEGSSKGKGKEKAHFPAADMMGFDSDLLQALDDYKLNGSSPQQAENIKARLDAEIAQGSGYALPDMLPMSSLAHQSPRDQLEEEYERAIAESEKLLQSPSSVLRSSPPWRPHTHAQSHMHVHGHAKIPELAPGPRNDAFLAQLTRQMVGYVPR